jgi:hypothetical protein
MYGNSGNSGTQFTGDVAMPVNRLVASGQSVVLLDVDLDIRSTPGAAGESGEEIGHPHLPAVLRP